MTFGSICKMPSSLKAVRVFTHMSKQKITVATISKMAVGRSASSLMNAIWTGMASA